MPEMCADVAGLDGKGDKHIEADAKKLAYRLDPRRWWTGRRRPRLIAR